MDMNAFSLKGKIAWITGASYGIGFAIAEAYASAGATIVFNDINQDLVNKGLAAYEEKGIKAHGYVCDVTDFEQVDRMLADIIQVYKKIDILVNNAGISKEAPFDEMDWKDIEQIFKINQTAPIYLMYKILPIMVQQKHGHVINIGSGGAVRGLPGSAAYL